MTKKSDELNGVLRNIEVARGLGGKNDSVRIVAVVSGSKEDKDVWQDRLNEVGSCIFNSDGSSLILSLQERIGDKTREGNFLGTLLAYRYIKEASDEAAVPYRYFVTLVGMLFGRGERMSPITQAKGCRKPATEVTPANIEIKGKRRAFTAIEEALLYFTPVAKYLEKRGFRGILNKWGDETQVASIDLAGEPGQGESLREHDVIKVISVMEMTEELARQKDWVVFDKDKNMVAQLSRNSKDVLTEQLKGLGEYSAGISLGPIAVSYDVLDIATEVFGKEIEDKEVHIDFDPYFLMALAMDEIHSGQWREKVEADEDLQGLVAMVPDFFEKVQKIKKIFNQRHGREIKLKTFDLGSDVYWADIGQHSAMREKFLALADRGTKGAIARKIANIPGTRDKSGNIIVNSEISPDVTVRNSVIVNSKITGSGVIEGSVIMDSTLNDVEATGAFAVRSVRPGRTVMKMQSGIYESLGAGEIVLEEGMRHVTVLTSKGPVHMKVLEDTNLRDKARTYNRPIFDNDISFEEAYNEMFGVSMDELEKRRAEAVSQLKKSKPLRFGTSGLRALVTEMTDMECHINTSGFIAFLTERKELAIGGKIAVGGDLRPSTPRIMTAVVQAIEDSGLEAVICGRVPTSTLAYYSMQYENEDGTRAIPGIMVTGSHVPVDRNGIKFTKRSGEVLKSDEADILRNVAKVRKAEYAKTPKESPFDEKGMFKTSRTLPEAKFETEAIDRYIMRYLEVFAKDGLQGKKIVLYQHSAVGRDMLRIILLGLGAEVITAGRSDEFIPVDTEKISDETRTLLRKFAKEHKPFAVVSTDGDSDRPLLADENGEFLPGDKLGALVSMFLKPDFAAIPISVNDAVVRALGEMGIDVKQTKIGSPYVIKAMDDKLGKDPGAKVVSWESNGGFLLGSDWTINGKTLKALPTRDAALALIAALLLAAREDNAVSELIRAKLPASYTYANVVDNKTKGCESYTPQMGKTIVRMFSPKEADIVQADFTESGVAVYYESGKTEEADAELAGELIAVKGRLSRYFTKKRGFGKIVSVNFLDGIRMCFDNGDISHLRPSGNAPEFRNYATADTRERAEEIVEKRKEIIPEIVADLAEKIGPKSLGAQAAASEPGSGTPAVRIAEAASKGRPLYILPYEEPKVWGVGGIGEYWYGAEAGEKSSLAVIGEDEAEMTDVVARAADEVLGEGVVKKFGRALPLVKILTPKGRLSVQFHDAKNELWIVTGIDKVTAGGEPWVIVGFSPSSVDLYGKDVTNRYREALEKYGVVLNALIDLLEENGYKDLLEETGDVVEAAKRVVKEKPATREALEWMDKTRGELEKFYYYRTVKVGDVIPIPAGTLHALGPGVEVVEPQITGPTQSLEDGSTYPVRYYFPGYEREGANKKLDIDRIGEMRSEAVEEVSPEVIEQAGSVKIERLPGAFEDKGLEVHRITLDKGSELEEKDIASFHNLVVIEGKARLITGGEEYTLPQASAGGEMLIVPAVAGSYRIVADEPTQIIDTFTPI
ncbi:hypothetical protein ACFL5Y_01250 [Candidatus Omnitrophota bacterium]